MKSCPNCHEPLEIKSDTAVYGRSYGRQVLICSQFPRCDTYCAIHRFIDGEPMGMPANRELRNWKINAHTLFDSIWKSGRMGRQEAYEWLSKQMGLHKDDTHMSYFNLQQCKQVVQICKSFKESNKEKKK